MAPTHQSVASLRYPRKTIYKASSLDVLAPRVPSTSEGGGGANLFTDRAKARPVSSGGPGRRQTSLMPFQFGIDKDDDVFTESSHALSNYKSVTTRRTPGEIEGVTEQTSSVEEGKLYGEDTCKVVGPVQIDAQDIYPPSACVFAANLSQAYNDQNLEIEVTKYFSQYGPVFVKIRRDHRQMPFAFCQFTCDADAQRAEKYGKGAMILGRPCRIEMAKAHSAFIVYKVSGIKTTKEEAINIMGILGEIARVAPLDENLQVVLNLPPSMVVHYKLYDPKRDVQKTFQKHHVFRAIPFEPKAAEGRPEHRRGDENQTLMQYDRDRRSAFFGNLPLRTTENSLASLVSSCGKVIGVDMKRKHIPQGENRRIEICFAFVEFVRPDSIDKAVEVFHNTEIDGYTIKCERKQSRLFETPRRMGQHASETSVSRSSINRRRAGGDFEINQSGANVSPTAGNAGPFASHDNDHSRAFTSPTAFTVGTYRPSTRQVSRHVSRASIACAGPASESSNAAPDTISASFALEPGAPDEHKDDMEDTEVEIMKGKGKGEDTKADDTQDKPKALAISLAQSETKIAASAVPEAGYPGPLPSAMGYPMMSPYSPYGYSPMPSYMPSPMTPQGTPMMYSAYPGSYYTPAPYQEMYPIYPLIAQYGPIPTMETPTRPAGTSQSQEQKLNTTPAKVKKVDMITPESKSAKCEGKGKEPAH